MQRLAGLVRQELEEVGRRPVEREDQRLRIGRRHAQLLDRHLALVHRLGVLDREEERGIARRRRRIHDPPEGEEEVVRRHRIPVRPLTALAHVEGVGGPVLRNLPRLRRARDDVPRRVLGDEPVVEIVQDARLRDRRGLVVVEGRRVGIVAPDQHDLRRGDRRAAEEQPDRHEPGTESFVHHHRCLPVSRS